MVLSNMLNMHLTEAFGSWRDNAKQTLMAEKQMVLAERDMEVALLRMEMTAKEVTHGQALLEKDARGQLLAEARREALEERHRRLCVQAQCDAAQKTLHDLRTAAKERIGLMQTGSEGTERRLDEAVCELRGMAARMDDQGAEVERLTRAVAEGQARASKKVEEGLRPSAGQNQGDSDPSDNNEREVLVWQREKVAKVIARLRGKGLTKAYEAWVAYVSDAHQAKASEEVNRRIAACKRFVQRILRLYLARSWAFFKESICTRKANRETLDKVLKRMSHRLLALALECYAAAVDVIVWQREKVAKVIAWLRGKGLTKAFEAWVEYVDVTRQEQAEQAKELAQTRLMADQEYRSSAVLAKEVNRRIDTCKRVVQRMLDQHKAASWSSFYESVMQSKANRETVDKVLKRMSRRSLGLALGCYAAAVGIIISKREKVAKVIAQLRGKGLTKAFEAWVAFVSEIKDEQAEGANIKLLKHVSGVSLSRKPKREPVTPGKPRFEPFNRADLYRKNQQQKSHQAVDTGVSSTNADFSSSTLPFAVQLTLMLGIDFSQAGEEGTEEREQFKRDLAADLASASGAPPASFRSFFIKKLSAGRVKVDMEIVAHPALTRTPEDMALDVEKQASDSNSLFRAGKLTKHTTSITHQGSPPPFSDDDGADEDEPNPAHLPGNMPHAETVSGPEVLVLPTLPAENIKKPSRSDHACPQPGLDFTSWAFGAVAKAPAIAKTAGYLSSPSPAAALLPCSTFPLPTPRSRSTFPPIPRQSKEKGGGEYVYETDWPSVPATPRPKIETIVPDPALGLLNCLCESKVLVCDTDDTTGPAFVYVCIDCGQMHHRAATQ